MTLIRAISISTLTASLLAASPLSAATVSVLFEVGEDVSVKSVSAPSGKGGHVDLQTSLTKQPAAPIDILFLAETTDSRSVFLRGLRSEAAEIVARTASLGDVAWSVASYRDLSRPPFGGPGDYVFRYDQTITRDKSLAADALLSWRPEGGGDRKASALFALSELASGGTSSYRGDSDRYLLWFGVYPSHNPGDPRGYPPPTLEEAIQALEAARITVLGFDIRFLDDDGELSQIGARTGGSIGRMPYDDVSDGIFDRLLEVIDPRSDVGFDLQLLAADGEPLLDFETTFRGLGRGGYRLDIEGDGGFSLRAADLALDPDPGIAPIPIPPSLSLLALGLGGLGLLAARRAG